MNITQEDRQFAAKVYDDLNNGRISMRQVYEAVKAGQVSEGATALLADGIDFGKFQAEDQMEAYKERGQGRNEGESDDGRRFCGTPGPRS